MPRPGRPPGARGEGGDSRLEFFANGRRDGGPVKDACAHDGRVLRPELSSREIRRASQDDQLIAVFHDGIWVWIELHAAAGPLDADHNHAETLAQIGVDDGTFGELDPPPTRICSIASSSCRPGGQLHEVDDGGPERRLRHLLRADVTARTTRSAPARRSFRSASSLSARPTMKSPGASTRAVRIV